MGYYIGTNANQNKAAWIVKNLNGKMVSFNEAKEAMSNPDLGVVVVLDNVLFEAAGFCFSYNEFEAFTDPNDKRRKQFVVLKREDAEIASGYKRSNDNEAFLCENPA